MLPSILQCTEQPPTAKNYPVQDISSAEVENLDLMAQSPCDQETGLASSSVNCGEIILSLGTKTSDSADIKVIGIRSKNYANGGFRENKERNHFYLHPLMLRHLYSGYEKNSNV